MWLNQQGTPNDVEPAYGHVCRYSGLWQTEDLPAAGRKIGFVWKAKRAAIDEHNSFIAGKFFFRSGLKNWFRFKNRPPRVWCSARSPRFEIADSLFSRPCWVRIAVEYFFPSRFERPGIGRGLRWRLGCVCRIAYREPIWPQISTGERRWVWRFCRKWLRHKALLGRFWGDCRFGGRARLWACALEYSCWSARKFERSGLAFSTATVWLKTSFPAAILQRSFVEGEARGADPLPSLAGVSPA